MSYYIETATGDLQETNLRPDENDPVLKERICRTKYKIGDGYTHVNSHYYLYTHDRWYLVHESSEGMVLYVVYKLFCSLNLQDKFCELHEEEFGQPWTKEDIKYGAKHTRNKNVTMDDYPQILDDLEDINYHRFANLVEEVIEEHVMKKHEGCA